jgi:hypothetical protein
MRFDAEQYGRQWLPGGIDLPNDASLTQALLAMVAEQDKRAAEAQTTSSDSKNPSPTDRSKRQA